MGFRVIGYLQVPAVLERHGGRGVKGHSAGAEEIKTGSTILKTIYWNMDPEAPRTLCTLEGGQFVPCNLAEGTSFKPISPRRSKEF